MAGTGTVPAAIVARAPKALLHDHLDGGLRPQTILDLAGESGYDGLPASDAFWTAPAEPWTSKALWSGVDLPPDHALS